MVDHKPLLADCGSLEGGLSTVEARARLEKYGRNQVPLEEEPLWKVFARQFMGTMPASRCSCVWR